MHYYTEIINLIIKEFNKKDEDRNQEFINNQFELMVHKFGNKLEQNHIKNPYKIAHNQLLKLLQMRINKTNLKINICDYIPECKTIYIMQYV